MQEKNPWFHIITAVVFCFIIANLVFLNVLALNSQNTQTAPIVVTPTIGPSQKLLTPTPAAAKSIQEVSPTISLTPIPTTSKRTTPLVKEYFVPFGTGTSSATDWEDLLGLQAYINESSYPDIKAVTFEVSLHNVAAGQAVYIRLYNATDNHLVWGSELTYTGGNSSELLVSKAITLGSGNKLYKVQVKTQLGAPVMIDNSRLRITLN